MRERIASRKEAVTTGAVARCSVCLARAEVRQPPLVPVIRHAKPPLAGDESLMVLHLSAPSLLF
jgi:hypothetical protein